MEGKSGKKTEHASSCSDTDDDSLTEIECRICDKTFWDVRAYEQHINGKKHHNQIMKLRMLKVSENQDPSELENDAKELKCSDCSLSFDGYKSYASHMRGGLHAKKLKKQALEKEFENSPALNNDADEEDDLLQTPVARCTLCQKEFSGLGNYKQHLSSSIHKKKLQEQKILNALKTEHTGEDEVDEESFKKCDVCDKSFSCFKSYNVHMHSAVHLKSLKRKEMEEKIKGLCTRDAENTKFICKECKKPFTDPFAFQSHIDNNSHKKYEVKAKVMDFIQAYPDIVVGKTIQNHTSESDSDEKENSYRIGDYVLVCKLCHMSFTGPESAKAHVDSKRHLKFKSEKEKMKMLLQNQKAKGAPTNMGNGHSQMQPEKKVNAPANNTEENDFELI